jgi:hypothetical protein
MRKKYRRTGHGGWQITTILYRCGGVGAKIPFQAGKVRLIWGWRKDGCRTQEANHMPLYMDRHNTECALNRRLVGCSSSLPHRRVGWTIRGSRVIRCASRSRTSASKAQLAASTSTARNEKNQFGAAAAVKTALRRRTPRSRFGRTFSARYSQ